MRHSKRSTRVGLMRSSSGMMTISTCLGASPRMPSCCRIAIVVSENGLVALRRRPKTKVGRGGFWASAAVRRDLHRRIQGFIPSARADFDQAHLSAWRKYGGEPGRPEPPSYVYGWGRAKHCSWVMPSPHDEHRYSRHQMTESRSGRATRPRDGCTGAGNPRGIGRAAAPVRTALRMSTICRPSPAPVGFAG